MSEPITATPSAPETMRATVLVAEATPDLAAGTAPTTASVAGAMTQPIARARPKNQATSAKAPVSGSQSVVSARRIARPVRPAATTRGGAESLDGLARRAGAHHQPERHRAHDGARLDRAVAVRELQVLGQREDPAEQGEEGDADRRGADAEAGAAEEAEVEHRLVDATLPPEEGAEQRDADARASPSDEPDVQPCSGRLDDRVHEEAEAGGGERGAEQVERAGPGIAALGHVADAEQQRGDRERHVDQEDRRPVEPLEQQPAGQRAEPDPDGRQGGPDGDRLAALLAA